MCKHRVGILFRVVAGIALVLGSLVADGVSLLLGNPHDLLVACQDHGLLLGIGDDGIRLLLRTLDGLLLLLDDAACLLELRREDTADIVDDLVDVVRIPDLAAATTGKGSLRLRDKLFKLIEQAFGFLTWLHSRLLSGHTRGNMPLLASLHIPYQNTASCGLRASACLCKMLFQGTGDARRHEQIHIRTK